MLQAENNVWLDRRCAVSCVVTYLLNVLNQRSPSPLWTQRSLYLLWTQRFPSPWREAGVSVYLHPPFEIWGLSFDSSSLFPLVFFCLSLTLSVLSFFCQWSILPALFFSINSLTFFVEVRLFWFDSCWELGDDSWWYVQLAAIPHWNLPLCIYRTFLQFLLLLFLSIPFSSFFLWSGISKLDCRYHHVLALCALLTGVILKELTCLKYL